jgi:hypothetical protein
VVEFLGGRGCGHGVFDEGSLVEDLGDTFSGINHLGALASHVIFRRGKCQLSRIRISMFCYSGIPNTSPCNALTER